MIPSRDKEMTYRPKHHAGNRSRNLPRVFLPVILLAASFGSAQNPPPDTEKKGVRVEGSTVDLRGKAVPKATLRLQSVGQPRTTYNEASGSDGKFLFDSIPPGAYTLSAEKDGYVTQRYGGAPNGSTGGVLTLTDTSVKDLAIRMTPQGVITGRVTDRDNNSVIRSRVEVLRYVYDNGRKRLSSTGSQDTNDVGEFRIANLAPGRYYISAADSLPNTQRPGRTELESNIITYYPGAHDALAAAPVDVAAGSELRGIDIQLLKERTYSVRGTVVDSTSEKPPTGVRLLIADDRGQNLQLVQVRADGGFEFRNLLPGRYLLHNVGVADRSNLTGRLEVTIGNSDLDNVVVQVHPNFQITGMLEIEDDLSRSSPPAGTAPGNRTRVQATVTLSPASRPGIGTVVQVKADGTFVLTTVRPLVYFVNVTGLPEGTYVKAVRFNGQDITHQTLNASSGTMDIVVSSKAADVSGSVRNDKGEATAVGIAVTLWPKTPDLGNANGGAKWTTTDQNGEFRLTGLAPGDYFVAAWEELEEGLAHSAEFLVRFQSEAKPVKVSEGVHEKLDPDLVSREKVVSEIAKLPLE
jgi:hypothetical protein